MAVLSETPAAATVEYARKALGLRSSIGLKGVAQAACVRLGLRRPSDFGGSMSRLLLTAAKQPKR